MNGFVEGVAEARPNRAARRARPPAPSVKAQRFASLCVLIAASNRPKKGEVPPRYMLRIRRLAEAIQREQRKAIRRAVRAARKANR